MVIDMVMVKMWEDQFRQIPPTNLDALPLEAKIAWRMVTETLRR